MENRYSRQIILPNIGRIGQEKLLESKVLVVGGGALGSTICERLARSGVGNITVIDRDYVEFSNLQRQALFDEEDALKKLPKAYVIEKKLKKINSDINIFGIVDDLNSDNIKTYAKDVDLIFDGTDNFEARFLINDFAVKNRIPWIYGGVLGTTGMSLNIIPEKSACLRCLMPEIPEPGSVETCSSAGILNTVVSIIAAIEVTEGLKILTGKLDEIRRELLILDVWGNTFQKVKIDRDDECKCCSLHDFEFLSGKKESKLSKLCGNDSVQIIPPQRIKIDLSLLEKKLQNVGKVSSNNFMLIFTVDDYEITIFEDGRAIIKGTDEINKAKSLYKHYIG